MPAQIPPAVSFDEKQYFGFEFGAAGISDTLIELINSNIFLDLNSEIFSIVEGSMNSVWAQRIKINNTKIASWSKYPNSNEIYPGVKYGAAGIIQTFLDIYEYTANSTWLSRAEEAYWQMVSEALNASTLPSWSYSYFGPQEIGVPITDIKYGSAGILNTAMSLFDTTNNQSYLDHASLIVKWLETVAVEYKEGNNVWKVLPWYDLDTTQLPIKIGYDWGNIGIATVLYRYSDLVNDNKIKDWSLQILDFIKSVQKDDGSWNVEIGIDNFSTDYDTGVAGVIHGLYEMEQLSGIDNSGSIKQAIDFLFSKMVLNETIMGFYTDKNENNIRNTFYGGLLGILTVLKEVDKYLREDQSITVDQAYEWLLSTDTFIFRNGDDKLLFFKNNVNQDKKIIDFSLSEGIAGMMSSLLYLLNSTHSVNLDINDFILSSYKTIKHFRTEDNLWSKMKELPDSFPVEQNTPISHSYVLSTDMTIDFTTGIYLIPVIALLHKYKRRKLFKN